MFESDDQIQIIASQTKDPAGHLGGSGARLAATAQGVAIPHPSPGGPAGEAEPHRKRASYVILKHGLWDKARRGAPLAFAHWLHWHSCTSWLKATHKQLSSVSSCMARPGRCGGSAPSFRPSKLPCVHLSFLLFSRSRFSFKAHRSLDDLQALAAALRVLPLVRVVQRLYTGSGGQNRLLRSA